MFVEQQLRSGQPAKVGSQSIDLGQSNLSIKTLVLIENHGIPFIHFINKFGYFNMVLDDDTDVIDGSLCLWAVSLYLFIFLLGCPPLIASPSLNYSSMQNRLLFPQKVDVLAVH